VEEEEEPGRPPRTTKRKMEEALTSACITGENGGEGKASKGG
jgi:hypothetical protein